MRTLTLHTIHVGALKNYTKSNNITKLLTELKKAIEVMEGKMELLCLLILEHQIKSTYYLFYDKSQSKTYTTIIPFSILLQILASPAKK